VIGRDATGAPDGLLFEHAAELVAVHLPVMSVADLEAGLVAVARQLLALGVVAVHDPGGLIPEPEFDWSFAAYARVSETGRLPLRAHVSMRGDALDGGIERGLRAAPRWAATPTAAPVSGG
jgi:predicted amidohydrolase YtcJ